MLLELTAPGQIGGNLSQLKAQRAWQFEVGTRGAWNERVTWDIAVYDIELWDEIQNVNVQPFPGAPFTIPRFQNIRRSRHTGAEVGLDVLLVRDLLRRVGLGHDRRRPARARRLHLVALRLRERPGLRQQPDLPGAPEHFLRAELRYDHNSGFWFAPGVETVPHGYLRR